MRAIFGIIGCIFSYIFLTGPSVEASSYDWSAAPPFVHYAQDTLFSWSPQCSTYYHEVDVRGELSQMSACIFEGALLSLAVTTGSQGPPKGIVRYPLDTEFHALEGACPTVSCVYAAETDTLIARFYTSSNYLGVRVFKHVSQRIQRVIDPTTLAIRFVFDSSHPDFVFGYENGAVLPVEAIASSRNGKWAAVEYRNFGIVTLNLETFETRRVLALGMRYGFGFDPSVELAVSDDGQTVAVMGERAGFVVAQIQPGCGDAIRSGMRELFADTVQRCPLSLIDIHTVASNFHGVYDPEFDESGGQLSFVVRYRDETAKYMRLRLPGYDVASLGYLGMGDSFSSGEGESEDGHYFLGTNEIYEKCHTSDRSYPLLLGRLLDISLVKNVACSGAKIGDVFSGVEVYQGQGGRLGAEGLRLGRGQQGLLQAQALVSFHPGRIAQAAFVERYEPQLVTIGIGGNSAGVMTKLQTCAMPGLCDWVSIESRSKVAGEIRNLLEPLASMYQRLKQTSPMSTILAIGYPRIIQPDGRCDIITAALFERRERDFIDETLVLLNRTIQRAAVSVGVKYIDTEQSFAGHQLCSESRTPAMNGVRLGDDIEIIGPLRLIGSETFHPTPFGHELLAQTIRKEYGNVLSPQEGKFSQYWGVEQSAEVLKEETFAKPQHIENHETPLEITLATKSVAPLSEVEIRLGGSVSRHLKTVAADEEGALRHDVLLPTDVTDGFYAIHLVFTSYAGEKVDLYQGISVGTLSDGAVILPRAMTSDRDELKKANNEVLGVSHALMGDNTDQDGSVMGVMQESLDIHHKNTHGFWVIIMSTLAVLAMFGWLLSKHVRSRRPP